jgi:hypothetical protein
MNQLQHKQPLTTTQHDTLLAVACADNDLLEPCFIGDLTELVNRGYIIHNNKFPLACELTPAGRELIPALVQNQAI